jgi:NAD(P)-dependent dehydrogenase (short-subunit alcohol dehydrogenase family)
MSEACGLAGAVVLVTGAGGNIGLAICDAFGRAGARVIATDLRLPANRNDGTDWRVLDVTQEDQWGDMIDGVRRDYGALHVLINNAGIAPIEKLEDMTLADWRMCQSVNVDSAFLGTKFAIPLLKESGRARHGQAAIVNIASGAADRPSVFAAAYCTSKAALAMLTRATAIEVAALGYPIRVNSVHPGAVSSSMMSAITARFVELGAAVSDDEMVRSIAKAHPMGRYVTPEQVADAVLYLASAKASYIHGEALHIDGGFAAA